MDKTNRYEVTYSDPKIPGPTFMVVIPLMGPLDINPKETLDKLMVDNGMEMKGYKKLEWGKGKELTNEHN